VRARCTRLNGWRIAAPKSTKQLFGLPGVEIPAGKWQDFMKVGGWPAGNDPTLSKLVYPDGLRSESLQGRGANSSGVNGALEPFGIPA
jgi:hypothetical protein